MDKIDTASSPATIRESKTEEAPKQQPKTEFAQVLQQKSGGDAIANSAQQPSAGVGLTQQALQAGAQQAAAHGRAAMGQAAISNRPMPMNPHLQKVKEAAKQFDQQLTKAKAASTEQKQVLSEARVEGKALDHARAADRASDVAKAEATSDVVRGETAVAAADARVKAEAQELHGNRKVARKAAKDAVEGAGAQPVETAKSNAASEVKRARKAREIPQELLDKLVQEVRVGVNATGQTEFQIDLKEGVLQGMSLKVTSENGKVSCTFVGGDSHAKNLVESSEQRLSRALEKVGLQLESLKVVGV